VGRLANLLYAACDVTCYQSPPGQYLPLFILTLLSGMEVVDPQIRLDPSTATSARVQSTLERLLRGCNIPESSLVGGLILAIDDVLVDCSDRRPTGTWGWSPATARLVRRGMLIDVEGVLRVAGECEVPTSDRMRQARADRDRWCEATTLILEEQRLEQAVQKELGDYES
jgi:hypothetical protein